MFGNVRKRRAPVIAAALLLTSAACALASIGLTRKMVPEAVTQGGGVSVSTSYRADQQAIGQAALSSQSASFTHVAGVVQPPVNSSTSVPDWQKLDG